MGAAGNIISHWRSAPQQCDRIRVCACIPRSATWRPVGAAKPWSGSLPVHPIRAFSFRAFASVRAATSDWAPLSPHGTRSNPGGPRL